VPRILVVDDEILIAMLLESWLTELGHEVAGPARSAADGLALIASGGQIDAAILDVNLGRENSYPVAATLQERGVPIAFATGVGELDEAAGFAGALLLAKPYDFAAVKATVERLLANAAQP
jgi:DNA-binding response OmpR family regulator